MAGGVHASSPGSATVTHQMGHSAFPPDYTLHSQTVLENGVSVNESSHNGETSTSRKRKLSTDAVNHQLDPKRTCIYNHLLTDMIIEKEKYLYISLLDKYRCGDESDFLNFVDKINYSDSVLPFPNPHQPKLTYLSNEPDHFKTAFPTDLLLSGFKKVIKSESNESTTSPQTDYSSKASYPPIVVIRPACRASNHVGDNSQQVAEKAKQEAYVLQRVSELQKSGLWSEKRLPKVQEPPRIKAHWDYVLEELEWLATDFAQERKWKKAAAKKRSRMVQKHFQEREALVQKVAKAAELHKKRIAGHLAKMVKSFWSGVEKVADFNKQEIRLKGKHCDFLTEKFSSSVAEKSNKRVSLSNQDPNRIDSSDRISDAEFEPNQSSSDDEETIEAEEKSNKANVDPVEEIEMLKRESELPLEDLLNQLPEEYLNNVETKVKLNDKKHIDDDDEYKIDIDESDDELTLLEEEKLQGRIDYKSEIAELEADNKLSVEDLKKKYNLNCAAADPVINYMDSSYSESSSDDSRDDSCVESSASDDGFDNDTTDDNSSEENDQDNDCLLSLLKDSVLENGDVNDEEEIAAINAKINDVAAIAESIQPSGITLSSTKVVSKVPFLLKHSLREYQRIGMDWLIAMYERKLNGILADEMGLGKTIQTIALLAHLASEKEEWGPHLIIVPTSVMLNWETEFKKWCPAFKILTYYGNPKERKLKRSGWTEPNTFHVCITSYKLVLQDHRCFRRKKWKYVILNGAQNIENFKSQKWQRLTNFNSERRLLLTSAPLQNNLTELWSSMNFLMPNLFSSHREFKEWFSNPVSSTSDGGSSEYNDNIARRLHKILRPFLLRRSKSEVKKQLPKRNEQVIMCKLTNRQRYLYDDYMSRAKTKEALSSGNLLNIFNVLLQLRKVCNHPDLLEPRPIVSPFQMDSLNYHTASLIDSALDYQPFEHVNLKSLNLRIIDFEEELTAWSVHRMRKLRVPKKLIEEIDDVNEPPPCPKEAVNLRLKMPHDLSSVKLNNNSSKSNLKVASFFKNISTPVSQACSASNSSATTTSVGGASKVKLGPIYRGMIAQGEVNNMAVKRTKLMDNTSNTKGGNLTFQLKSTKFNTVPQKICITTTSSKTPIHATVLKNVLPVTLKNTQTGGGNVTSESGNGDVVNPVSTAVAATPSTSFASSSGSLPTVMVSTSVISLASAGSSASTKLSNSISQIVQNSGGKSVILATSNSVNKPLTSTATMKTSGQKVILKNIGPGNLNTILGPIIRKPSAQQATILNNGNNVATSSSIILNNTQKTSITIPKPISTFVTSSVAVSTVTSSVSRSDTVSTTVGASNKNNRDCSKASGDILFDNQSDLGDKRSRKEKLRVMGEINERKSSPYVMFGCDVRNALKILDVDSNECPAMNDPHYWKCVGHTNCVNAQYAKHVYNLYYTLTSALSNSVKSIEERIEELSETFSKFIVYVPAVNARRPSMRVSRPSASKSWSLKYMECALQKELAPPSEYLNRIVSRMSTTFPDNRLVAQDCGKLKMLDTLLRRLKVEQHRVLIFTQMTHMLDVLEAFLTFRGHIYLRLDGGTKFDQRQVLTERFNTDEKYFCFILSTRAGGVGVNLTGADTVIFYDNDWNPTTEAFTQDRCNRIGLARDLNVFRLLSEKTVEENLAKKTNRKKLMTEVAAIDVDTLTSVRLKSSTIRDLFDVDSNESDSANSPIVTASLNAFESVLAAVEDESDVNAAKLAKDEALAESEEFDENSPFVANDEIHHYLDDSAIEIGDVEQTVNALLEQLTPIERWALQFLETAEDMDWSPDEDEHLAAAVVEAVQIEQQKKEWEIERFLVERSEMKSRRLENENDDELTQQLVYSSEDSKNQAWLSFETMERMPIWLPLPPLITIEENEEYIDRSMNYLYETTAPIPEHLLPAVYYRKEKKKLRLDQPSPNINESSSHIRVRSRHREGLNATLSVAALEPPKSLFDRPSQVIAKLRQDMRLQKYRGLSRSTVPNVPGLKPYFPPKMNADPDFVPEWLIHEDYALLQAIQHVQELPLNLSVMYPGHTPNWDLVSELVNQVSRIYRSPQQCKNRFETAILPREEGKLTSDPIWKKQKKMKGVNPLVTQMKYTRNYKTAQLYVQDSNSTYTQMMNSRFDAIRTVSNRRAPTLKHLPLTTKTKNPKHAQLLAECEIDYDRPLTPVEIAAKRAQRLAKEKQTQMASAEQHSQLRPAIANVLGTGTGLPQQQHIPVPKSAVVQQAAAVQQTAAVAQQQQQQQQLQTSTPVAVHKSISIPTSSIVSQPTAVVVNISQNSPVTTSPVTIRSIVHRPLNVQEMIVAGSTSPQQQSSIVIPSTKTAVAGASTANVLSPSIQRIIPITQISTSTTATGQRIVTTGSKTLTSPQLQLYRQQNVQVRQQPLKILQSRGGRTSVVVPANMVVTSQAQQQQQQAQQQPVQQTQPQPTGIQVQQQQPAQQTQQPVQQQSIQQRQLIKSLPAGAIPTSTTRNITEAEMAALLKKQQLQQQQQQIAQQQKIASATVIVTSNATSTPTQFITAQSTTATGQNTVGVTLPTIKTASIKTTATQAQIRQIQQHLLTQQRKLSAQKITPIGQVMVNVTQSGGQVISHVLTKTTSGNVASAAQLMGARVIPVVASNSGKQTFQVVSASQLRANNASTVNVDTTAAARHIQQNLPPNAIKISGGTSPVSVAALTHPQNFLNQVSAAMQNNTPLAVRQGNLRIQNATIASSLVSSSPSGGNTTVTAAAIAAAASSPSSNSTLPSASAQPSNNEKG